MSLKFTIQQRMDALTMASSLDEMADIAIAAVASNGSFSRGNFFRVFDVVKKSAAILDPATANVIDAAIRKVKPRSLGHGPSNLLHGDMQAGYFGELTSEQLFSGEQLATEFGVDQGELMNSDAGWLKFAWRGQVIFIAKRQFMHSVSWDHLYSRGIVYGTDDDGSNPRGGAVNQYKIINRDAQDYVCQLLTGAASDPVDTSQRDTTESAFVGMGMGSMWNDLIYRVSASVPAVSDMLTFHGGPQLGDNWASFSDADLGITGNGRWKWMQEMSSEATSGRVNRGTDRVSYFARGTASSATTNVGWLPCLVLKS